ncbi:hypothetical protein SAMN05428945_1086 [Streptomyces sp. 2224.1]|nr:hypothetical protein SAMN05428945_1086 [Streptomyces sp. 2224.1]SEE56668.1 hypothetical protein SAMN05428954_3016 [Streptomyces sp. 2112.3]
MEHPTTPPRVVAGCSHDAPPFPVATHTSLPPVPASGNESGTHRTGLKAAEPALATMRRIMREDLSVAD